LGGVRAAADDPLPVRGPLADWTHLPVERIKQVRNLVTPHQIGKTCLLENGLTLAELTNNQILARVG